MRSLSERCIRKFDLKFLISYSQLQVPQKVKKYDLKTEEKNHPRCQRRSLGLELGVQPLSDRTALFQLSQNSLNRVSSSPVDDSVDRMFKLYLLINGST